MVCTAYLQEFQQVYIFSNALDKFENEFPLLMIMNKFIVKLG